MKRLQSERGISAVDVLVSVALTGIIAAVTVPNVQAMTDRYNLNAASTAIASRLGEARTNSLKRNRQVSLVVDPGTESAQIQTVNAVPQNIGAAEWLPQGIEFDVPAPLNVTFDALGRPVDPPQIIQLRHAGTGMTRTVTVTSTGRIVID
jgi:type II secretory pathway pseudopilin PulG